MNTYKSSFEKTKNVAQYLFSYNTLRDQHLEFFIRNRISMNLIHHVGIQHIYGVSSEMHKIYNQLFVNNYYSPTSQWYQYKHNGVKNTAGVVQNPEQVLLEFFEYIWNTPN